MKSFAAGVIIIFTSAPDFTKSLTNNADLYAAMLPHTPSNIFLPFSIKVIDLHSAKKNLYYEISPKN